MSTKCERIGNALTYLCDADITAAYQGQQVRVIDWQTGAAAYGTSS